MRKLILLTWIACLLFGTVASAQSRPSYSVPVRIRASGAVIGGLLVKKGNLVYPEQALQAGLSGNVISKVLISKEGKIVQAEVVEGDPLLSAASIESLRAFRFHPYLLEGSPVEVESQMGFRFSLRRKPGKMKGEVEYEPNVAWREDFRTGFGKNVIRLDANRRAGPDPLSLTELAGKCGAVYVTVLVGADGTVTDVKLVGGDQELANPVISAVKQFTYEPQMVNGRPVAFTTQESFHFARQSSGFGTQ